MNATNKRLLKDLLRIPTRTGEEFLLVDWLMDYFNARHDCHAKTDAYGNIYVTRGLSQFYPCVAAHTDTVHRRVNTIIHEEGDKLYATDWAEKQVGCGGDDKAGVYLCLKMIEAMPVVKAVFFVAEETGCNGSRRCDASWFADVGYVMEFDSPGDTILTFTCDGTQLFPLSGPFFDTVMPLFKEYEILDWQHHPYTDVSILKRKFDFACLNLPAGYYRMHTPEEYVQMSVVERSLQLGLRLAGQLGTKHYPFTAPEAYDFETKTPVPVTFLKTRDFGMKPERGAYAEMVCKPEPRVSRVDRLTKNR